MNYLKYFGFTSIPFHKSNDYVWINRQVKEFEDKFRRLIEVPGIGLLVGDAGVGKTTLIKHVMNRVKSPKIRYFYFCETDFTRNEFYLILADQFGVDASSKRSIVWRNLKKHIMHMSETQAITPIIIIDEAHNLPDLFFKDLPAFLNFNMDSRDPLVLWLLGASSLSRKLNTPMCHALNSRIRLWQTLNGLTEFEDFKSFVNDGLKEVGASGNFLTDSGLNLLFETTKGKPRQISNIIINGLQKSAQKDYQHIPDDVLEDAIYECR